MISPGHPFHKILNMQLFIINDIIQQIKSPFQNKVY